MTMPCQGEGKEVKEKRRERVRRNGVAVVAILVCQGSVCEAVCAPLSNNGVLAKGSLRGSGAYSLLLPLAFAPRTWHTGRLPSLISQHALNTQGHQHPRQQTDAPLLLLPRLLPDPLCLLIQLPNLCTQRFPQSRRRRHEHHAQLCIQHQTSRG